MDSYGGGAASSSRGIGGGRRMRGGGGRRFGGLLDASSVRTCSLRSRPASSAAASAGLHACRAKGAKGAMPRSNSNSGLGCHRQNCGQRVRMLHERHVHGPSPISVQPVCARCTPALRMCMPGVAQGAAKMCAVGACSVLDVPLCSPATMQTCQAPNASRRLQAYRGLWDT